MSDIEKAKKLLFENNLTCVLCKAGKVYTSGARGVSPMVNFLAGKTDLHGFSAADRIVGKAAALLFVLAKVKEVYSEVMSKSAAAVFDKHGISYSCGVLTDRIINRKGDDICPMEKLTMNIDDPALAYSAISKKLSELMADRNSADKKL